MKTNDDDNAPLPPSKSALKRAAEELQDLGKQLVAMQESRLAELPLPDALRSAIAEAKRIKAREGLRRQMQYVGRLMRELDIEPLRQALSNIDAQRNNATRRFHQAEQWRDRLLKGGEDAITAFATAYPTADAQALRQAIAAVATAHGAAAGGVSKVLWKMVLAVIEP
ncbi:MAG: ribosome biogenesis factor YjgA [Pseudomonadota bacterium]|mgnify:CR=1 FL=1